MDNLSEFLVEIQKLDINVVTAYLYNNAFLPYEKANNKVKAAMPLEFLDAFLDLQHYTSPDRNYLEELNRFEEKAISDILLLPSKNEIRLLQRRVIILIEHFEKFGLLWQTKHLDFYINNTSYSPIDLKEKILIYFQCNSIPLKRPSAYFFRDLKEIYFIKEKVIRSFNTFMNTLIYSSEKQVTEPEYEDLFEDPRYPKPSWAALSKVIPPVIDENDKYLLGDRDKAAFGAWVHANVDNNIMKQHVLVPDNLARILNNKVKGLNSSPEGKSFWPPPVGARAYKKYYPKFLRLLSEKKLTSSSPGRITPS
jgi:hypothetical protein